MDVFDAGPPTTLAGARRSRTVVFKDSRVASRRFSAHDIRGIGEVDNRAPPSEGESSRAADGPLLGASSTLQSQSPPLQLTGDEAGADHMPGCCWGGILSGRLEGCGPPVAAAATNLAATNLAAKFCPRCQSEGISLPANRVFLAQGLCSGVRNGPARDLWATSDSVPGFPPFRVVNNRRNCSGGPIVIFKWAPLADDQAGRSSSGGWPMRELVRTMLDLDDPEARSKQDPGSTPRNPFKLRQSPSRDLAEMSTAPHPLGPSCLPLTPLVVGSSSCPRPRRGFAMGA